MSSRVVDGCFGVFFVALGAAVLVYAEAPPGEGVLVVAAILALLGVDCVWAAIAGRRSLLSRIGPLP